MSLCVESVAETPVAADVDVIVTVCDGSTLLDDETQWTAVSQARDANDRPCTCCRAVHVDVVDRSCSQCRCRRVTRLHTAHDPV